MTQDIGGCSYPKCDAGSMVSEIKEANREYRLEIREQLQQINSAVRAMADSLAIYMKNTALVEQSIKFLREGETENKAAHIVIFKEIEKLEVKLEKLGDRGTGWLWDLLKMLIIFGLGIVTSRLF